MPRTNRPPRVGDPAPDFTLPTGRGALVTLTEVLTHHHVVLYFVREYS